MKILITGANGLLGQKLVKQLSADPDVSVIASGKGPNRNPEGNYRYVPMDITNINQVDSIVNMVMPEVIIHTAAMTNVDACEMDKGLCWKLNVDAVKHIVQACESNSVALIHLSTDFVFDGKEGPYKETDIPNPLSYYAESKLASEKLIQASHIKWAIARTQLVYGVVPDMSRSNIVLWARESLASEKQIQVVNDQWRTPTLAEDLAKGCILIAKKKAEGIFHISGEELLSPYEIALQTAIYFNLNATLIKEVNSSVFTQPAKRPKKTGFIIDKAKRELDFQPVNFKEGLKTVKAQLHEI